MVSAAVIFIGKMPFKLLALDLDGTLLRSDHTPHPYALNQLLLAQEQNIKIVVASGRSIQSIRHVLGGYWEVNDCVATNGADVWTSASTPVSQTFLNDEVKGRVIDFAVLRKLHLSCYSTDGTYALHESSYLDEYRALVKGLQVGLATPDEVKAMPIFKLVFIAEPEDISMLRKELEPELLPLGADLTESAPRYLEVMPSGVNKGRGLRALCTSLGIDLSEVAAIGDYLNDTEMLQNAGLSGAVANAHLDIKNLSQVTVSSNEEGGVGEFIARYVLQR